MRDPERGGRSILVVTVHKGASTFIADEFATAAEQVLPNLQVTRIGSEVLRGTPINKMPLPSTGAMFVRVYPSDLPDLVHQKQTDGTLDHTNLVLLYRDPRDAAVSMYYSTAYSHSLDVRDPERLLATRERLQKTPVHEGVKQSSPLPIREFQAVRKLARENPSAFTSSYEELVGNYDRWLRRFCKHVGWSDKARTALHQRTHQSFTPPEIADPSNHKRRITPGNWRDVFDDELIELFKDQCGQELTDAGYVWD